ncbi:MAG: hypothetical protein R2883_02285 [Caldisericia bacterium]
MKREKIRKKHEKEEVFVDRLIWLDNKDYTYALVTKIIEKHSFSCVEICDVAKGNDILIKAVVWNENGVDIADLVRISKDFLGEVEQDKTLNQSKISEILRLDLSSPGIDRVLKSDKEFEIFNGLDIQIFFSELFDGKDVLVCKNLGIKDNKLKVDDCGKTVEIDFELIKSVRLAG